MNLNKVTITGADDSTSIDDLVKYSKLYPFVEWGILVSKKQEGGYRFPSNDWCEAFGFAAKLNNMQVSMHMCGKWVRDLLVGDLNWAVLPYYLSSVCQRIQINTHAEPHILTAGLLHSMSGNKNKEFIFQWDGVNNLLPYAVLPYGYKVSTLFDTSGGIGRLPDEWPEACEHFPCGYAGGLAPYNVIDQLKIIDGKAKQPYWIDMERRVRTEDDSMLDMTAVDSVLSQVSKII